MSDDITKIDIYELLELQITADEKEIRKSYRKKAISCHPDKNPDNPKAAELFCQLTKALEILLDGKARAAYDRVLRAKKAAALRNRELDSKSKKFKDDLEAKELIAQAERDRKSDAQKLQAEIERLRKEGSRLIEEELELMRQQNIEKQMPKTNVQLDTQELPRLKLKWKAKKGDSQNGGYSYSILHTVLSKHGHVTGLVISTRKQGSAIVEFSTLEAAKSAFYFEKGNLSNPLIFSWISGDPAKSQNVTDEQKISATAKSEVNDGNTGSTLTSNDYESLVFMRLRQAEERKRLIQQMMEEDGS